MKNAFYVLLSVLFTKVLCSKDDSNNKSAKDVYPLDHKILMKLSQNMELFYSGFMEQKLDVLDTVNQKCKNHTQKVMADLGKETYSLSSK